MTRIAISDIRLDGSTQVRKGLNHDGLTRYQEAMQRGDVFPPIVIYNDGVNNWLADGFHRVYSALAAGFKDIDAEIREGDARAALDYALEANGRHGINLTTEEKRGMVITMLSDPVWGRLSDNAISKKIGVAQSFVSKLRNEGGYLRDNPNSGGRPKKKFEITWAEEGLSIDYYAFNNDFIEALEPGLMLCASCECESKTDEPSIFTIYFRRSPIEHNTVVNAAIPKEAVEKHEDGTLHIVLAKLPEFKYEVLKPFESLDMFYRFEGGESEFTGSFKHRSILLGGAELALKWALEANKEEVKPIGGFCWQFCEDYLQPLFEETWSSNPWQREEKEIWREYKAKQQAAGLWVEKDRGDGLKPWYEYDNYSEFTKALRALDDDAPEEQ